jgi:hypothetical protein
MASISGNVTIAGDPDDWIACAFDADTHAFSGVAAVSGGAYSISGLTAGKAYVVSCRPKSGAAWAARDYSLSQGDYCVPFDPATTPYTFKATSVAVADPYFDNVVLLLPCDGGNNSTTFTDVKGHTVTANGNAKLSTSQAKWGASSAVFDGNSDYLHLTDSDDWTFGGDFTLEAWVYPVATASMYIFSFSVGTYTLTVKLDSLLKVQASVFTLITGTTSAQLSQWNHVAFTRSGTTVRVFLNGNLEASANDPSAYTVNCSNNRISESAQTFNGYVDDIRITKGVARYTSSFSVASSAFPTQAGGGTGTSEPTWPITPGATVVDEA